jgi:hypothetical protein
MTRFLVVGFRLETWERFAELVEASDPRTAEDMLTLQEEKAGRPIAVCAVLTMPPEWEHTAGAMVWSDGSPVVADQYATWILPDAQSQDEVDQARLAGGYHLWSPAEEKKKRWGWGA